MEIYANAGGAVFLRHLEKIGEKYTKGKVGLYARMAVISIRDVQDNFLHHGRPKRWKPIQPRWKRRGRSKNKGMEPLRDTGRLFNSIRLLRLAPSGYDIGTTAPYAVAQNEGEFVPKRTIKNVQYKGHVVKTYTRKGKGGKPIKVKRHKVKAHKRTAIINAHVLPKREFMNIPEPQLKILFDYHNKEVGMVMGI